MSHRSSRVIAACLAALAVATPVRAQHLEYLRARGGYSVVGFGGGNFKLTCDSGCTGDQRSASDVVLLLGHQFGARLRFEVGGHFQRNSETSSILSVGSVGFSYYLAGNLYVRGAGTWMHVDVPDTGATNVGNGGPGFTVGAGYELFVADQVALTPYANYVSGSVSKVDRTVTGNAAVTTAGTVHALNFGVSIGHSSRRPFVCVTAAGQRVDIRRNFDAYRSCEVEVVDRLFRRLPRR
jgi:hypothetical protein